MAIKIDNIDWDRELPYFYWLISITGFGKKTVRQLLHFTKTAEAAYAMRTKEAEAYLQPAQLENFLKSRSTWDVRGNYEELGKKNIILCPQEHPLFPARLTAIPDAPYWIFFKGRLPEPTKISIAIIGARRCSEYGRYMARRYGEALAREGIQIISGMASGVDGISQRGAMAAGGASFGVLGCGADICYPEENRELYHMLVKQGGIISEYLPGTKPQAKLFPPRNRIISGLADAVIVIEAKEKSGTLITVDMALEQGKEVYALPGRATDVLSRGCNRLIKQGAGLALSPEDLVCELSGENKAFDGDGKQSMEERTFDERNTFEMPVFRTKETKRVWEILDDYPQSVESLSDKLEGMAMPALLQTLMELCISEYAEQVSCGCYVRKMR